MKIYINHCISQVYSKEVRETFKQKGPFVYAALAYLFTSRYERLMGYKPITDFIREVFHGDTQRLSEFREDVVNGKLPMFQFKDILYKDASDKIMSIKIRDELFYFICKLSEGGPVNLKGNREANLLEKLNPLVDMESVIIPEKNKQMILSCAKIVDPTEDSPYAGLEEKLAYGKARVLLFYGPPGTGKTMSTRALAKQLNYPIYQVNIPAIFSMWLGESENNLKELFGALKKLPRESIVLFDEADALISTRTLSGHETFHRMKNIFLQEIEKVENIIILTSNFADSLDPALTRRILMKIKFDIPDEEYRFKIWEQFLHQIKSGHTLRKSSIEKLAAHKLTGGEIKNVLLNTINWVRNVKSRDSQKFNYREIMQFVEIEETKSEVGSKSVGFKIGDGSVKVKEKRNKPSKKHDKPEEKKLVMK
ncbi:ATP-binding protein [bacterium]|nr:ATP-binding protein [bacterium]